MRFTAKLVTERELDRGVQKFAPDQVNSEGLAREFLNNGCVSGDAFEIYETRQIHVATLRLMSDGKIERTEADQK